MSQCCYAPKHTTNGYWKYPNPQMKHNIKNTYYQTTTSVYRMIKNKNNF